MSGAEAPEHAYYFPFASSAAILACRIGMSLAYISRMYRNGAFSAIFLQQVVFYDMTTVRAEGLSQLLPPV